MDATPNETASLLQTLFAPNLIGGTLLILSTTIALIWANSGAADYYDTLWTATFTIGFEGFKL